MAHHVLKATCDTVHYGGFSDQLPPVLTVQSGDYVTLETFSGVPVYDQAPPDFVPLEFLEICRHLPSDRRIAGGPHLLTGPIDVAGAQPGDVLEIRLEAIAPRCPIGFTLIRAGGGVLPPPFDQPHVGFTPIDLEHNTVEFPPQSGVILPLRPFFGVIGVATAERVRHSIPPGDYGGNLDNRHLTAPARLFLPVFIPGARLSIGDGHALQGDGEVCVTALETSMNGTVQLILHPHNRAPWPWPLPLAETPTDWLTMGFGPTLDEALAQALTRMVQLLQHQLHLSTADAYMLCSLGIHFQITQAVNLPRKGVHARLAKAILPQPIAL